jgi:hypothetical protein
MAITMVALVASGAWAMAMVLSVAWGFLEVVAVTTSVPLSIADTGPLDFTEKICHYF